MDFIYIMLYLTYIKNSLEHGQWYVMSRLLLGLSICVLQTSYPEKFLA